MALFITRVELHHANHTDYDNLHGAMSRRGFTRTIRADDGRVYHLPTAEYSLTANLTIEAVRERASAAAADTNKSSAVLVLEGSAAWVGLNQVS